MTLLIIGVIVGGYLGWLARGTASKIRQRLTRDLSVETVEP
jgi:hypothetical protein